MSIRPLVATALAAALVAGVAHAATPAAPAPEDKWEITTKMEMAGMPFAMPATTAQVCLPANQQNNEKMVPADSKCKVTSMKTSGATTNFHVECPAPQQMSGDGSFTRHNATSYSGTMAMKGNVDGRAMDMKMSYAGKKIGVCDPEKDKMISAAGIQKESQRMQAQSCAEIAKGMSYQVAPQMAVSCPTIKADICKNAKTMFDGAKTSGKFVDLQEEHRDWQELAGYCGMDTAAMQAKYCTMAKKEQNWNNAAMICGDDAELDALAKKQCTGKNYSVASGDPKYRDLCARYAAKMNPQPAAAEQPASTGVPALDKGMKAMEGLKQLKGLFGR